MDELGGNKSLNVIFCHGKESGPVGTKSQALIKAGLEVSSPDFRGLGFEDRVELLSKLLRELEEPVILVGSSLGGAVALAASERCPGNVEKLVLCAPALWREWWPTSKAPRVSCEVLHGTEDEVIPFELSKRFCTAHSLKLTELPGSNHRLGSVSDLREILSAVTS